MGAYVNINRKCCLWVNIIIRSFSLELCYHKNVILTVVPSLETSQKGCHCYTHRKYEALPSYVFICRRPAVAESNHVPLYLLLGQVYQMSLPGSKDCFYSISGVTRCPVLNWTV